MSDLSVDSGRLHEIIADYLHAEEAGRALPREELLAAHPDLADDLRRFFSNRDEIAAALPGEPPRRPFVPPKVRYFGDYELLDEIARGGLGVVYRARQTGLNRTVANILVSGTVMGMWAVCLAFCDRGALISRPEHVLNAIRLLRPGRSPHATASQAAENTSRNLPSQP